MRKVITIVLMLLAVMSTVAKAADITVMNAHFEMKSKIERLLIVTNTPGDSWLNAQRIAMSIEQNLNPVIVNGLQNNVPCEKIAADITNWTRDRFIQPSLKTKLEIDAANDALSAQTVYTMAQCYNLKG